jgi:hypothetical protein
MPICTGNTPLKILDTEIFQTPSKSIVYHHTDLTPTAPKLYNVIPKDPGGPTELDLLRAAQANADAEAAAAKRKSGITIGVLAFGAVAVGIWFMGRKK